MGECHKTNFTPGGLLIALDVLPFSKALHTLSYTTSNIE